MEKRILFGVLIAALLALSATPVLACNGGGGEIFDGTMIVGSFRLTNGTNTVSYGGIINIDRPYVLPFQINPYLTEAVQITTLTLNVSTTTYSSNRYIDLGDAEIIPTSLVYYVCDIRFGDVARMSTATITACDAYNVPVCDMTAVTDVAVADEPVAAE
jgi:hypothetical protein